MKRECCECGATFTLTHDFAGTYDTDLVEQFNAIHSGEGHSRVSAGEAALTRNEARAREYRARRHGDSATMSVRGSARVSNDGAVAPCEACGHRRIYHFRSASPARCSLCGCGYYQPCEIATVIARPRTGRR